MQTKGKILRSYLRSALGFWRGPTASLAWSLCVMLLLLIFMQLYVQYRINFWNRDFFNALSSKDVPKVWQEIWLFIPLAISSIVISVLSVYAKMAAQRRWRQWMSHYMIDEWVENSRSIDLTELEKQPKNAEYRIAEDARVSTDLPFEFGLGLISSILTAITFIAVLWEIGGTLNINMLGSRFVIPGYLVWVAIIYSVILTITNYLFAKNLTRSVEDKNSTEAEYRSAASGLRVHIEENNHSISRMKSISSVKAALDNVTESWRLLSYDLMRTTFVSSGNSVFAPVMGLLFCAPKFLNDGMSIGQVVQAAAAFVTVQNCFNWLLNNYAGIADWLSSSNRAAILLHALKSDNSDK